jgi:hypothetical protein
VDKKKLNNSSPLLIENVITVNHMFELLPFDAIDGNALAYNRENVPGDVQMAGVGTTITAKAAATSTYTDYFNDCILFFWCTEVHHWIDIV